MEQALATPRIDYRPEVLDRRERLLAIEFTEWRPRPLARSLGTGAPPPSSTGAVDRRRTAPLHPCGAMREDETRGDDPRAARARSVPVPTAPPSRAPWPRPPMRGGRWRASIRRALPRWGRGTSREGAVRVSWKVEAPVRIGQYPFVAGGEWRSRSAGRRVLGAAKGNRDPGHYRGAVTSRASADLWPRGVAGLDSWQSEERWPERIEGSGS